MKCPFLVYGKIKCHYMKDDRCEDIETCPSKEDSTCGSATQSMLFEDKLYNNILQNYQ